MQDLTGQESERGAAGGEGQQRVFLGLGERLQELADLGQAQLARMALAVEEDEAASPVGEDGDGWLGVAVLPSYLAKLIEQARRRRRGSWLGNEIAAQGCSPRRSSEPLFVYNSTFYKRIRQEKKEERTTPLLWLWNGPT